MPRPRNNQSCQRLLSLTTNATTNSSRSNINGVRSIDIVKPIMTFVSRSAHAQPKFKWEEKRKWGVSTPEDLEKRINRIRKLSREAQLCIQDCTESINTTHFKEELQSATKAVENADLAYSELLEELASQDRVQLLNEVRRLYASEVESGREELRGALDQLKNNE